MCLQTLQLGAGLRGGAAVRRLGEEAVDFPRELDEAGGEGVLPLEQGGQGLQDGELVLEGLPEEMGELWLEGGVAGADGCRDVFGG